MNIVLMKFQVRFWGNCFISFFCILTKQSIDERIEIMVDSQMADPRIHAVTQKVVNVAKDILGLKEIIDGLGLYEYDFNEDGLRIYGYK